LLADPRLVQERQDREVGGTDVDSGCGQHCVDLAAVVGLVVEHLNDLDPARVRLGEAIHSTRPGHRLGQRLGRHGACPGQDVVVDRDARGAQAIEVVVQQLARWRRRVALTVEPRQPGAVTPPMDELSAPGKSYRGSI
jgi:hypothetical protein